MILGEYHDRIHTMEDTLSNLVRKSSALTGMLISKEGTSIAEAGDTSFLNTTAMAALIAGMFSATREVARMVGEEHFSILLQQGKNRHIHISLVTDSLMMVVVFEDYQRIGRVRHESRKAGDALVEIITKRHQQQQDQDEALEAPQFKEFALNLIDRIFTTD